ncbi:tRNA(Ile)-lysidine synthase [Tanacetum coccineum]
MARASLIIPHYTTNSHLIRTGLSLSLHNFTKVSIFSPSRKLKHVRFLCGCLAKKQNDSFEVEKYKDMFSKRMAMAGLEPHHRIAVGVSGGPDSMALCLLAANWKTYGLKATSKGNDDVVDGLLAIIVDHGLRAESKDEAEMVQRRVLNMGIRCEIAHCEWADGKPKLGHLQEAARDVRYQ